MTAPTGVVARWATSRTGDHAVLCDECGAAVTVGQACPGCRQTATSDRQPATVGMLAAVIDTPAGARLVVAQRTHRDDVDGDGNGSAGWLPIRTLPATTAAVRTLARQATQPAGAASDASGGGGLW